MMIYGLYNSIHWESIPIDQAESEGFNHRCPFPIGWLINRGACLPL